MQKTEGYIAGDLATAFFTSPIDETLLLRNIDIIFCGVNRWMCLRSWFLFLRQEGFVAHESFSVLTVRSENIESGIPVTVWSTVLIVVCARISG
jgi:hypothetical protein